MRSPVRLNRGPFQQKANMLIAETITSIGGIVDAAAQVWQDMCFIIMSVVALGVLIRCVDWLKRL